MNTHVLKMLVGALLLTASLSFFANEGFADEGKFKVAFGSCAYETEAQPIWFDIAKKEPDVFLFIGDNQYADVQYNEQGERMMGPVTNPTRFKEAYDLVNAKPGYAALKQTTPIMGTWDDHDYGENDGGKDFPLKQESQQAFLDFFEFAKNDPIREQAGIYHSKIFTDNGRTVHIIMLDTRYHRDELDVRQGPRREGFGRYKPSDDTRKSLLGDAQWAWLSAELTKKSDVKIIVSSIQVVAYEHSWESWGTLPHERDLLYSTIKDTKAENVFFLSGDRHLMEISKDVGQKNHEVPYPIWDFTASGMTQAYSPVSEANSFRVSKAVRDTHYGMVEIDWATDLSNTKITFTAYGLKNKVFDKASFTLKELSF
jgi:alkaline phosphatase D